MKLSIPHAKELQPGLWTASVSDDELRLIPGRAADAGGMNMVSIADAEFRDGTLSFPLKSARITNFATGRATLFVTDQSERTVRAEAHGTPVVRPSQQVYWVTVPARARANFAVGMDRRIWGVEEEFRGDIEG